MEEELKLNLEYITIDSFESLAKKIKSSYPYLKYLYLDYTYVTDTLDNFFQFIKYLKLKHIQIHELVFDNQNNDQIKYLNSKQVYKSLPPGGELIIRHQGYTHTYYSSFYPAPEAHYIQKPVPNYFNGKANQLIDKFKDLSC